MPVLAPRPEGHRTLFRLALTALAGVLLGLALILPRGEIGSARLRLYGEALPDGPEAVDDAVAQADKHFPAWFNLELPDGTQYRLPAGALGVELDRPRLRRLILDTGSVGARWLADAPERSDDAIDLVVPIHMDRQRALAALLALKEVLDQPAIDARLDLDSRAVVPERPGRRLDADASLAAIEDALQLGAAAAPLAFQTELPRQRARELADVRHEVLLGAFETALDASPRARDRRFNLMLAASKLDGHVLMPGAEFDFNATVGPRDEARGYRVAALAAAGELVDGNGSSTSQVSGTLHAAALFAGLDVVERHPPVRPGAIALGLDADVAYPIANLRLKNTHDFPVVLRAIASTGRMRAEVRGPERPHTVSLVIQVDGVTPFDVIESADTTLETGVRVVAQRGVPGINLHRYRIRRDGAHAVREVSREQYRSRPHLIHVGAGTASAAVMSSASVDASTTGRPPPDAATSELDLNELVVFSQSNDPSAPLTERRIRGRFAVPERSKDIGAPAWTLPP